MSVTHVWAGLAGLGFGLGLLLLVTGLPALNKPGLSARVAPHLRSTPQVRDSSLTASSSLSSTAQLFAPIGRAAFQTLGRLGLLPSSELLAQRLRQARLGLSPAEYRLQQLVWAAAGGLGGALISALGSTAGGFNPLAAVLVVLAGAVLGAALRNQRLSARIATRQQRMLAEFPTIAELLALAVSAGETVPSAFHRISHSCRGEMAEELGVLMARVRTGTPFGKALRSLSHEIQVPALERFFEGVLVAVDRGTPLAEVMHAQAADARDVTKRELMESAGRKEIAMLAPVIFGILPLTIIFAAFPGLALLQIGL